MVNLADISAPQVPTNEQKDYLFSFKQRKASSLVETELKENLIY